MSNIKSTHIYLLRHGKPEGSPALYGQTDVGVSSIDTSAACDYLLNGVFDFEKVLTSPLRRCCELAELLVNRKPSLSFQVAPAFQEMSFGMLDGVPFDDAQESWPQLEAFWENPSQNTLPDGELLGDFYERVASAWKVLTDTEDKNTLIVCHGGTIRMILAHVLQLDWRNSALFSTLSIGYHSITHIELIKADWLYFKVHLIGGKLTAFNNGESGFETGQSKIQYSLI